MANDTSEGCKARPQHNVACRLCRFMSPGHVTPCEMSSEKVARELALKHMLARVYFNPPAAGC
jgi:hypothetical protein